MADKLITDLQLRDNVTDDVNLAAQDGVQSYRVTAAQFKNYVLADNAISTPMIQDNAITMAKLAAIVAESLTPSGSVMAYAGASAPTGYLLCEGQAVSRTTYAALFGVLGITHGQGDGSTTFNVPDYRGRFLRGVDGSAGRDPNKLTRVAMNTGGNAGNLVGSTQLDALQNLTGQHRVYAFDPSPTGVFTNNGSSGNSSNPSGTGRGSINIGFDASQVARTSTETRPLNAYVNYIIKT